MHRILIFLSLITVGTFSCESLATEAPVAANVCEVLLEIPEGTEVVVDGKAFGQQREFTFGDLKKSTIYVTRLQMAFPSGQQIERSLLIEGGRRLRVSELDSDRSRPELAPQDGHRPSCVAFRPDGQAIASGGFDNAVKLWDAKSGILLRTFSGHKTVVFGLLFSAK